MNYTLAFQKRAVEEKSNYSQVIVCRVRPQPLNANTQQKQGQIRVPWHHSWWPRLFLAARMILWLSFLFISVGLLLWTMSTNTATTARCSYEKNSERQISLLFYFVPRFFFLFSFFAPNLPKKTKNMIRYSKLLKLQFTILMPIASRPIDCAWVLHREKKYCCFVPHTATIKLL